MISYEVVGTPKKITKKEDYKVAPYLQPISLFYMLYWLTRQSVDSSLFR